MSEKSKHAPAKTVLPAGVSEEAVNALLKGAVDLHCHSGPSVMPRRVNHIQAMEEAENAGFRALLFKDHYYSVTPIVGMLDEYFPKKRIKLLSGVPLNNPTGGFNCYAVDHGLKLGANIVWMPTFSAANHIRRGYRKTVLRTSFEMLAPTGLTVLTDQGKVKDEVKVILGQIAASNCVLASGHLHISEIFPLFDEARKIGVKRLLVNHPTFVVDATMEDIGDLARSGAFIEHSMCMYIPNKRFDANDLNDVIKAGGVDQTILASDLGQSHNPTPVEGFRYVIATCLKLGYSAKDIRKMTSLNACRLMGLDEPAPAKAKGRAGTLVAAK